MWIDVDEQLLNLSQYCCITKWDGSTKFHITLTRSHTAQQYDELEFEKSEERDRIYEEMKIKFSATLASKWSVNALDFIFTYPVFRNNNFVKKSGIPAPSAARFTRILLEKKLITTIEEASGRRPALYSFEPLLQLVRV